MSISQISIRTSGKGTSSASFSNNSPGHSHRSTQKQISTSFLIQYTTFSRRAFVCFSFSEESSNCRPLVALVSSVALLSNSWPNKQQSKNQINANFKFKRQEVNVNPHPTFPCALGSALDADQPRAIGCLLSQSLMQQRFPWPLARFFSLPLKIKRPCRVQKRHRNNNGIVSLTATFLRNERDVSTISLYLFSFNSVSHCLYITPPSTLLQYRSCLAEL